MKTPLRAILLVAAAITLLGLHAEVYKSLTFDMSDGSTVIIPLSSSIESEINDNQIVFSDGTNVYSVDAAKINNVELRKDIPSAIREIDDIKVPVITGRTVCFSNLPADSVIMVCAVDGRIVKKLEVCGDAVLSLEDLPAGIYLVNVNKTTIKISLK